MLFLSNEGKLIKFNQNNWEFLHQNTNFVKLIPQQDTESASTKLQCCLIDEYYVIYLLDWDDNLIPIFDSDGKIIPVKVNIFNRFHTQLENIEDVKNIPLVLDDQGYLWINSVDLNYFLEKYKLKANYDHHTIPGFIKIKDICGYEFLYSSIPKFDCCRNNNCIITDEKKFIYQICNNNIFQISYFDNEQFFAESSDGPPLYFYISDGKLYIKQFNSEQIMAFDKSYLTKFQYFVNVLYCVISVIDIEGNIFVNICEDLYNYKDEWIQLPNIGVDWKDFRIEKSNNYFGYTDESVMHLFTSNGIYYFCQFNLDNKQNLLDINSYKKINSPVSPLYFSEIKKNIIKSCLS